MQNRVKLGLAALAVASAGLFGLAGCEPPKPAVPADYKPVAPPGGYEGTASGLGAGSGSPGTSKSDAGGGPSGTDTKAGNGPGGNSP